MTAIIMSLARVTSAKNTVNVFVYIYIAIQNTQIKGARTILQAQVEEGHTQFFLGNSPQSICQPRTGGK